MAINRRTIVKAMLAYAPLVGLGVVLPGKAFAIRNKSAFEANTQEASLQALFNDVPEPSNEVTIKAPNIAIDGSAVPVIVYSTLPKVDKISLFVADNQNPLVAQFLIHESTEPKVATRIFMQKTSRIMAVVEAEGKLYSASKETKVSAEGCGKG